MVAQIIPDSHAVGDHVRVSDLTSPFYGWQGKVVEQIVEVEGEVVGWPLYRVEFEPTIYLRASLTFSGGQLVGIES